MIERVRLIAWYEFRSLVLRRAFVFMLLAPLLYVVLVLTLGGGMGLAASTVLDGPRDRRPRVVLVDDLGVGDRVRELAPEIRFEAPADGPLPRDVALRVEIPADAATTGRFRIAHGELEARGGDVVADAVRRAVGEARLERAGVPRALAREALSVEGERVTDDATVRERMAPVVRTTVALMLHFLGSMSVFGSLVAAGVADKSNRVAEVLLGAVTPGELLAGRLIGAIGASTVLSWVWLVQLLLPLLLVGVRAVGLGAVAASVALLLLGTVPVAAAVAALGSLADEPRDAQRLTSPVLIAVLAAYAPAGLAIAEPGSTALRLASLIPPTASPAMVARLCSADPPAAWEVAVALLGSAAFAVPVLWLSGRVYGVGLLSRGGFPGLRATWRLLWQL